VIRADHILPKAWASRQGHSCKAPLLNFSATSVEKSTALL